MRIVNIAVNLSREIRQPRKMEAVVQMIQQREICMPPVEVQVERRAAHNPPLDPEIRIVGKVQAEKVDRQIFSLQEEGRTRTFHRNIAVYAVQHLCTSIDPQGRGLRPPPADAEIDAQRAVHPLRQRHVCCTQLRE